MSYTITKGIKRVDGCEDFELCGTDSIGCAANVSVSFNGNDEILKVKVVNPPKADKQESSEWSQVGDEVSLRYKFDSKQVMHTGNLLYLSDNHIIIATDKNSDYHCHRCDWSIEKPKTPEEELRDEIVQLIDDADGLSSHVLALALMDKYDIKKKPQQEAST